MNCLDDCHHYQLEPFENKHIPSEYQQVLFIKKEPTDKEGELRTVHNGTTNEEVLEMLIHRLNGLQNKFSCRENAIAITHCEIALLFLEKRTRDRQKRGVEGQHKP